MPFRADYLTPDEVDDEYRGMLCRLEREQLFNVLQRLANPLATDRYDAVTLAIKTIEHDWEDTKRLRAMPQSPGVTDGCDSE